MEFRKMKSSDYNKVRGVIVENCNRENTAIHEEGSSDSYGNVPEYKESFLKQKSVQKVEKKIKKTIEETKTRSSY